MSFLIKLIERNRASVAIVVLVLVAGVIARTQMTIETFPNVAVPFVVTQVVHLGISPEDGARLIAKPIEQELETLDGVVEVRSTARENLVYTVIEFDMDKDIDVAISNVREAIDIAKAEFPDNTEEPIINEISAEQALVIVVSVSSAIASERDVFDLAEDLKNQLEAMPQVLEVTMKGAREEVAEILVNPSKMDFYNVSTNELVAAVARNNLLVPAGDLDSASGNFGVKVPALIENTDDIKNIPVRSSVNGVIRLGQVADIKRTFKDAAGFARVYGRPAITLEVVKRLKANTADTSYTVRELVDSQRDTFPSAINVDYVYDTAFFAEDMVNELTGNIVFAMALVMVVVVASLGLRSGLLVGFGIPFSLLGSMLIVQQIGFSFNFMVMFGLLLALGMLIDGAIVVVEYAVRLRAEGVSAMEAYVRSVKRMGMPVFASTLTTMAAFLPIMFWPGVMGEFMGFLPVTVFAVLIWSLIFSLVVVPVLGVNFSGEKNSGFDAPVKQRKDVEFSLIQDAYLGVLGRALDKPLVSLAITIVLLYAIFFSYSTWGRGTVLVSEDNEDVFTTVTIRAQGNLTVEERVDLVVSTEEMLATIPEVKSYYISSGGFGDGGARSKDEIAGILLELVHSELRDLSSSESLEKIRGLTNDFPGIIVQVNKIENGPPTGKDVQVEIAASNREILHDVTRKVRRYFDEQLTDVLDIEDTLSLPGIEWRFEVDRTQAAMHGIDVAQLGRMVQLVTDGMYLGEYRPDDADAEVELRLRYPPGDRSIERLKGLRVATPQGPVPISSFVNISPMPRVAVIQRVDSLEYTQVIANTEQGVLASDKVSEVQAWLDTQDFGDGVSTTFRGGAEEADESTEFLAYAAGMALSLMMVILVAQFNSFYQAILILSAVIMSTAGVLLGLLLGGNSFSVIMTGVGLVALAGIVVNNNIVLIDTFNKYRLDHPEESVRDAAYNAAHLRFRPVFLTSLTTIIGLLPLANGASVNLIGREIQLGGQMASFWSPMASSIVNGLAFSTLLTLLVTPVMLVVPGVIGRSTVRTYRRFSSRLTVAHKPAPLA
ncbi:MAG: efflux RND transporter permease subunit [Proteobacteria bacterium]|nr:efflux RND transporter permease subunit [Pseudomonadota bacterium]